MAKSVTNASTAQGAKAFDYVFKLLVVGDSSVGKTCLLFRYCENTFYSTFISTIGIDFKIKTITLDGKTVKLQIWDTAGQERFRTITTAYYRGAMGIIFVYDVTSSVSFENLKGWFETAETHANSEVERMILGNKCDVQKGREVTLDQANSFARPRSIRLFEVSAKTGDNVDAAFLWLAKQIKTKADRQSGTIATSTSQTQSPGNVNQQQTTVSLTLTDQMKTGKCSC